MLLWHIHSPLYGPARDTFSINIQWFDLDQTRLPSPVKRQPPWERQYRKPVVSLNTCIWTVSCNGVWVGTDRERKTQYWEEAAGKRETPPQVGKMEIWGRLGLLFTLMGLPEFGGKTAPPWLELSEKTLWRKEDFLRECNFITRKRQRVFLGEQKKQRPGSMTEFAKVRALMRRCWLMARMPGSGVGSMMGELLWSPFMGNSKARHARWKPP